MKRLTFWFVVGIFAVTLVRARVCPRALHPEPVPTTAQYHILPVVDPGRADLEDASPPVRESADGLPVPIVPGTRVSEAEIKTPGRPRTVQIYPTRPVPIAAPSPPADTGMIKGQLSATGGRAVADALAKLRQKLAGWLTPEVPTSWRVPEPLVDRMIRKTQIKAVEKDYGTLYEATLHVRFTPEVRAEIVETYRRELVSQRLTVLAGVIAFILACLAALTGYIRADEATKGYYTHWLRAVAAAGVGASGVLIYQMLT